MTYVPNTVYQASTVLAAAVPQSSTVVFSSYPTGTSQATFTGGLAGTDGYVELNGNDKYTVASGAISITYGASTITITNLGAFTWAAGSTLLANFDAKDGNNVDIVSIPVDLASIAAAYMTGIRVPYAGVLEYAEFVVAKPATTAAKLATLGVQVDGQASCLTVPLTSATAILGAPIPNVTDPTTLNTLTASSKISIVGTGITAFVEGSGALLLHFRPVTL